MRGNDAAQILFFMVTSPMFTLPFFSRKDTFCVRAYTSVSITPHGEVHVCCSRGPLILHDRKPMSLYDFPLGDIVDSKEARRIRKKIVSGKKVSDCRQCREMESGGFESRRTRFNKAWEEGYLNPRRESIKSLSRGLRTSRYAYKRNPVDLQLSLGNRCNLRCRICRADYSSSVAMDAVQSKWNPAPMRTHVPATSRFPDTNPWFRQERVYEELFDHAIDALRVNVLGGEPIISGEFHDILKFLVKKGLAERTRIILTTNGTVFDRNICEELTQFLDVQIGISLDAIDSLLNYIRYPSDWPAVEKNIHRYGLSKNLKILINPTLCIYNILHLTDVIHYANTNDYALYIGILENPPFLSIDILPPEILALARRKLLSFAERNRVSDNILSEINKVADYLSLPRREESADNALMREFMIFTNDLDRSRNQDFTEACPELYEKLLAVGVDWIAANRHA